MHSLPLADKNEFMTFFIPELQGFLSGHERKEKAKLQFTHVPYPDGIKNIYNYCYYHILYLLRKKMVMFCKVNVCFILDK